MNKNSVNLKDIIWVIGINDSVIGKEIFESIPYVKEVTIKGYEDLIDLTNTWATAYCGKITDENIITNYERTHNAKAKKIITSVEAIKKYILNHDNLFKSEIERFKEFGIDDFVGAYCYIKVLNIEEGTRLIKEINKGVAIEYNKHKQAEIDKDFNNNL